MIIDKKSLLLENDNLYLRPLAIDDITDEYINGLNDPEVNKYLDTVRQNQQTKASVTSYVKENWDNPLSILCGIFIKNDGNPFVGTIRVHDIDYFHYFATIGICLFAKRAWGKGYAHQALLTVKDYLFSKCKLHYLEAGVYAENLNSINCFLNAGFVEQYRVSKKYRHIDRFKDAIYFTAVNPQFDSSLITKTIFILSIDNSMTALYCICQYWIWCSMKVAQVWKF